GLNQIKILSSGYSDVTMHVLAACIGASMKPLQLLSPELMKGEKQQSLVIPFAVMVACLAVALALFLMGQIKVSNKEKEKKEIEKKLEENQRLKDVKTKHETSQATYNKVIQYNGIEKDYNERFVAFLEELEQKMPSSYVAYRIAADETQIQMDISCVYKEDLATIAQQLYKFDTVTIVQISQVTEALYVEPEPILPEGATPTPTPEVPTPTPEITEPPIYVETCTIIMQYNGINSTSSDANSQAGGTN
ncbi:MAG: hypothetical protein J5531_09655, partial [Lachnospiraceae bacterium]|nr:hypothetical protein [Lachnospiraceae bacterium]